MDYRVAKAKTLHDMLGLLDTLRMKASVLEAMDRDRTASDSYDLVDQLNSMFHQLDRLNTAVSNAVKVVGVDAELTALFEG